MDDFEYSVEIGDRDWASFFAECEECNLLPASLAGVDDSGMSDMDDPFLSQRVQRVDSTLDFSEQDQPRDSPPDCEGSPVGHRSGKQGLSGIDSVLSGSEEDIHMQSINIYFERLKDLTEVQPSQERAGNKKEAKQEEECWCKGQQAGRGSLPIDCAKLNTLSAGVGKEATGPVDTIRNVNPIKRVGSESNVSSKPATSCDSAPVIHKSAETEIFIKEETAVKEMTQWNSSHHSAERVVCSENTPQSYKVELCRSMDDTDQETSSQVLSKKSRVREDHVPTHKLSPSVSLRRKRRKKRPLSVEGGGDEEVRESHVSVKCNNLTEELQRLKEGEHLSLSQETFDCLKEPKNSCKSLYNFNSSVCNSLEDSSVQDAKSELPPSVSLNESLHRRSTETSSTKGSNHRSETRLRPSEDHRPSAPGNGANEAANTQPCSKLQLKGSAGENWFSWLQVSVPGTEKSKSQKQDVKGEDLHESDQTKASVCDCKKEQTLKDPTVEVKSVSLSSEPCAPGVEVSQNISAAKSVLAAEPGHDRDERKLHQSGTELQRQLENSCHSRNHCHAALENTHFSEITTYSFLDEGSKGDMCTQLDQSPVGHVSKNLSGAEGEQQMDHLTEVQTSEILSESLKKVEKTPFGTLQLDLTSQNPKTKVSLCEELKTNPPGVTLVSSQSVVSKSHENSTDLPLRFCSPATEHEADREGKKAQILAKHDKYVDTSEPSNQTGSMSDLLNEAEEATTASKEVNTPEKSVYAMSSFWNEMEKLTIKDILGLRQISKALPPVQEGEETEGFPVADSGVFTEMEESKAEQIPEEMTDSSSLRAVSWESEPVPVSRGSDVYPERSVLAPASETSQPVLTERARKCLRKISKTVSVHNLQALDPRAFSYTRQNETIEILEQQKTENLDLTENAAASKSKDHFLPPSSTESYSISFTNIFQYLFGGKQSVSSQSAPDDATTHHYTSGNSVPETYDHFFSEFDSESFFYPLTTAEEQNKDEPVPIFSYSRSTGRNLQFPEAYEHFFASSSSDDSSVESEEEDTSSPVRVVSRFTRKASSNQLSKDAYEDFFTDKDLREDFLSLKSLSFRKINFTAPTVQDQNSDSVVPVSSRFALKIDSRLNVLGNPDVMLPDPLLYHLEDRISKQLALKPFRYEDLQVSNPRLDAPFLPLKQSDMCLVCIAFASWVLKTANPQVGDAWKAVLLANVSALSAIRYLRKYVKAEAATSEMKPPQNALTDS